MEPPEKRVCYEVEPDNPDLDENSTEQQTGWFDLPYEMRRMVLDMVPLGSLVKFAQCSKQCSEEAWESNNYFKEIWLTETPKYFRMKFSEYMFGVSIEFQKFGQFTQICFESDRFRETSDIINETAKDLVLKYLEEFLRKIGRNLKVLYIRVNSQMRNRLVRTIKLRNLRKLTQLALNGSYNQICPLKWKFVDIKQMSYVTKTLNMPGTVMNFERLTQLKAKCIFIEYTELTPNDLNKYIKLWRDGKLHKSFYFIDIEAGYNEKKVKRRIELDLDGIECEEMKKNEGILDVSFKLKSSCEWLQDVVANVEVVRNGMAFLMRIVDKKLSDI